MRFYNYVFVVLGLFVLFIGCSTEADYSVVNKPVEIQIGVDSDVSPLCRGDGMINNGSITSDHSLSVSFTRADQSGDTPAYSSLFDATTLNGTISKNSDGGYVLKFNPVAYYLNNGKNTKLIGWYPVVESENYIAATNKVRFTIDGSTDIMKTDVVEGNKNSLIPDVTFKHALTQIKIMAYTEDSGVKNVWGGIKSVTVKNTCGMYVLKLPSPVGDEIKMISRGFDNLDLPLVKKNPADNSDILYDSDNPLAIGVKDTEDNHAVVLGYAMICPVDVSADTGNAVITLAVETENEGTKEVDIVRDETGGFQAGYSYAVSLKFAAAKIAPSVTITEWEDVTNPDAVDI